MEQIVDDFTEQFYPFDQDQMFLMEQEALRILKGEMDEILIKGYGTKTADELRSDLVANRKMACNYLAFIANQGLYRSFLKWRCEINNLPYFE